MYKSFSMYNLNALKSEYAAAVKSGNAKKEQRFTDHLMLSSDPAYIAWHYELLDETNNTSRFYNLLILAFIDRGAVAGDFLLKQLSIEQREHMQRRIIDVLGWMKHPAVRELVLRNVQSPEQEKRRQACYVLSWVGRADDLAILRKLLQQEPEMDVRVEAAMSLIEWADHLPAYKTAVMHLLIQTLRKAEGDSWEVQEFIAWLVISAQQISGLYFGIDEAPDTIGFSGDVFKARENVLATLKSMNE